MMAGHDPVSAGQSHLIPPPKLTPVRLSPAAAAQPAPFAAARLRASHGIAVGAWSVTWNIGPGWEDLFYESYGVAPDPDRITFYRLLYDLAS